MMGPSTMSSNRVPLKDWDERGWRLQASCSCGHRAIVPMRLLLRKFGPTALFGTATELKMSEACRCERCDRNRPRLDDREWLKMAPHVAHLRRKKLKQADFIGPYNYQRDLGQNPDPRVLDAYKKGVHYALPPVDPNEVKGSKTN
jgi:hypothetical protein